MACDTTREPILQLISYAYMIAGTPNNGVLTGQQADLGKFILNNILHNWNGSPLMIPYMSNLFIDSDGSPVYLIGHEGNDENPILNVPSNPFTDISSVTYNIGDVTYTCTYMAPPAFNSILIKNVTGLSGYYTFELRDTYTILRLYPVLQPGAIIKCLGKKRLSDVTYFSSQEQVPLKYREFLAYAVASRLIDTGSGTPSQLFTQNWPAIKRTVVQSNNDDYSLDKGTKPSAYRRGAVYGRIM